MKNEKKSYKVQIFGDDYTLISDESEQHIRKSAQLIDSLMTTIAHDSSINDPKKIVVLAALRIASVLLDIEQAAEEDDRKKAALIEDIEKELLAARS